MSCQRPPERSLDASPGPGRQEPRKIQKALDDAPAEHREAMQFLVSNMPDRDLRELPADLLENFRLAYQAGNQRRGESAVPHDIFLNDVLPYANINERRDACASVSTSSSVR